MSVPERDLQLSNTTEKPLNMYDIQERDKISTFVDDFLKRNKDLVGKSYSDAFHPVGFILENLEKLKNEPEKLENGIIMPNCFYDSDFYNPNNTKRHRSSETVISNYFILYTSLELEKYLEIFEEFLNKKDNTSNQSNQEGSDDSDLIEFNTKLLESGFNPIPSLAVIEEFYQSHEQYEARSLKEMVENMQAEAKESIKSLKDSEIWTKIGDFEKEEIDKILKEFITAIAQINFQVSEIINDLYQKYLDMIFHVENAKKANYEPTSETEKAIRDFKLELETLCFSRYGEDSLASQWGVRIRNIPNFYILENKLEFLLDEGDSRQKEFEKVLESITKSLLGELHNRSIEHSPSGLIVKLMSREQVKLEQDNIHAQAPELAKQEIAQKLSELEEKGVIGILQGEIEEKIEYLREFQLGLEAKLKNIADLSSKIYSENAFIPKKEGEKTKSQFLQAGGLNKLLRGKSKTK